MSASEEAAVAEVSAVDQLFSRRATGLVRLGTPWRVLVLNFANIGLTYIWFTYWITPGVFPQSNLILSIAVAGAATAIFAVTLAAFASAFPRSGGEYVYVSRTLHPSIGFACSVAAALSQCFWIGIGGYWISTLVLSPVCTAIGISSGSSTLSDWGTTFSHPNAAFIVGSISVVCCLLVNLGGLRAYFRFQSINLVVGVVTFLVLIGVFLFSSHADFVSGINSFAKAGGGSDHAYSAIMAGAKQGGMPGGITVRDTLGIFAVTWLLAFASSYIGGEVRTPKRTQIAGTVYGSLLYTAVAILLLLAIYKAVPSDFNKAAGWMNYNSADYYKILPADPTFVTWAAALVHNTFVLVVILVGLVVWSFFWLPSAMIIATRAIFAWSLERLAPAQLSAVSGRSNAPVPATVLVAVIGECFLIAYWRGWFTYLTPFLAYAGVFSVVSIAAVVAGYRPSTRAYLEAAGWDRRILGVPVISLCGIVGIAYWGIALYFALTVDALALNTTKQLVLTGAQFVVPFIAFFVVAAIRRSRGIRLEAAYTELPPE